MSKIQIQHYFDLPLRRNESLGVPRRKLFPSLLFHRGLHVVEPASIFGRQHAPRPLVIALEPSEVVPHVSTVRVVVPQTVPWEATHTTVPPDEKAVDVPASIKVRDCFISQESTQCLQRIVQDDHVLRPGIGRLHKDLLRSDNIHRGRARRRVLLSEQDLQHVMDPHPGQYHNVRLPVASPCRTGASPSPTRKSSGSAAARYTLGSPSPSRSTGSIASFIFSNKTRPPFSRAVADTCAPITREKKTTLPSLPRGCFSSLWPRRRDAAHSMHARLTHRMPWSHPMSAIVDILLLGRDPPASTVIVFSQPLPEPPAYPP